MMRLIYPKFWQSKNIISYLLWPLSVIYLFAGYIRKIIARPITFPCKVICVGNINIGGTGKTQIVIYLAKLFKAQNINFVIITKAYGSKLQKAVLVEKHHTALDVGDESIILLQYGRVIATKKIQYITSLINDIKPSILIIDDSMQNPNFYKDCTILSVDAHRLFGNEFLIPAGPLRQYPDQSLRKADIIILISLSNNIIVSSTHKIFQAQITPYIELDKTKTYFAFTGIGNPERFFATLQNNGAKLLGYQIFPDHHNYSDQDFEYLKVQAQKHNALLITTRKDYVKICNSKLSVICYDINLSINNEKLLINLINEKLK